MMGGQPIRSHSASMLIISPIFPPEEMYDIFISVETPVANRPFEAAAKDLVQRAIGESTRRDQSLWILSLHEESLVDSYDVSRFAIG
jgi:hypothetical protein